MDFSKLSDEELAAAIKNSEPSEQKTDWLGNAGNIVGKFNKVVEASRLPAFAGGLLQGAGDIGASLGNIVAKPLGHPIPHPELSKFIDTSPLSRIAFGAGELASQIPLYSSGAGAIGRLGLTRGAGLGGRVAEGAAAGAAMGENQEGDGFRGALEGAAIPIAGRGLEWLNNLRSTNIARNVMQGFRNAQQEARTQFNNVFDDAAERGVRRINAPHTDMRLLRRQGNIRYLHSLEEFYRNPSLRNAHNAQSDLAKYAERIGDRPANTLARQARDEALRTSERIRHNIFGEFSRSGNTDLALQYHNARNFYRNVVGHYLDSPAIRNLEQGNLCPRNFAKKIQEEEGFMANIGQHEHPEIDYRRRLLKALSNKMVQYAGGSALSGLGLYGLAKMLK